MWGAVFGHIPKAFNKKGKIGIDSQEHLIKIDNGMAPESGAQLGSLLMFSNPEELLLPKCPKAFAVFPSDDLKEITSDSM